MFLQSKELSALEARRYERQRVLEGVGEAGQRCFFETEVVCGGEGLAVQTAAAYLEAAGFGLTGHATFSCAGFRPLGEGTSAAGGYRQRGYLGQFPCGYPEGFDFWVGVGSFGGRQGFLFGRGGGEGRAFWEAHIGGATDLAKEGPMHLLLGAWAALVFERLALGFSPEAGGGSLEERGELTLWEA